MNIVPRKAPSAIARLAALLIPCLLLSACGGGGSSSSSAAPAATPSGMRLLGVAQKGPFQAGATVTVQRLNASGQPEGAAITSRINSALGDFEVAVPSAGVYLVTVQGSFL